MWSIDQLVPSHSDTELSSFFRFDRIAQWISSSSKSLKQIAIQLADPLLPLSCEIYTVLTRTLVDAGLESVEVYVLSDVTDSACCPDTVSARRAGCQAVILLGHTCLSHYWSSRDSFAEEQLSHLPAFPLTPMPVFHSFGTFTVDLTDFSSKLLGFTEDKKFLIIPDCIFSWYLEKNLPQIEESLGGNVILANLQCTDSSCPFIHVNGHCLRVSNVEDLSSFHVCFVYNEDGPMANCDTLLGVSSCLHGRIRGNSHYSPYTGNIIEYSIPTWKFLKKRYFLIEKIRDASPIGFVLTSAVTPLHLACVRRLQAMMSATEKTFYVVMATKLTPEKLANYPDVSVFVLVGCPDQAVRDRGSQFYQTLVTPFDVELALHPSWRKDWNGSAFSSCIRDHTITPSASCQGHLSMFRNFGAHCFDECGEDGAVEMSLLTMGSRTFGKRPDHHVAVTSSEVIGRNQQTQLVELFKTGQGLAGKTWSGLDPQFGETGTAHVQKGRSGLPAGYANEPTKSHLHDDQQNDEMTDPQHHELF